VPENFESLSAVVKFAQKKISLPAPVKEQQCN